MLDFLKLRKALTWVLVYVTIVGLVTFTLFIFEESIQMATFGTWPAQDAKNWELVLEGMDVIESINLGMKTVNYLVGWIQPLAFFSYRAYAKSTDYYVKGVKAKIFAYAPSTFDGRLHSFHFIPNRIDYKDKNTVLINRKVRVLVEKGLRFNVGQTLFITGKVRTTQKGVEIKASKICAVLQENPS